MLSLVCETPVETQHDLVARIAVAAGNSVLKNIKVNIQCKDYSEYRKELYVYNSPNI
jgi:hypothetical protein